METLKRMRDEVASTKEESWTRLASEWNKRREGVAAEWIEKVRLYRAHCAEYHANCHCLMLENNI